MLNRKMSEAIKPSPKSKELSTFKRQDSVVVESESEYIDHSVPKSRGFSVDFSHTLIFKHNPINADNMNALSTPLLKKGSGLMPP